MSRLHTELRRLYGLDLLETEASAPATVTVDPAQGLRGMVLTLSQPAEWARLHTVWRAVQDELGLPAPGIAVDGTAGLQLWFALAQPAPAEQARSFLAGLCQRHLADVPAHRLQMLPGADAAPFTLALPGGLVRPEQWSAFVAPDLAPMFADTPWLDLPPPLEGQAELLSRLQAAGAEAFAQACALLRAPDRSQPLPAGRVMADDPGPASDGQAKPSASPGDTAADEASQAARRFLLQAMNDDSLDMRWRIEAARALLAQAAPVSRGPQRPGVALPGDP